MPQFQPTIRLPFGYVQGIPREAAVQIRRDFEEVINNMPVASTVFDAIIDPVLTTSSAGTHHYKNLTDLLASENWTTTFSVGVVQRAGTAIVEPGVVTLVGKGNITFFGIGGADSTVGVDGWRWATLTSSAGQVVNFYNINFEPTSTMKIINGGLGLALNCYFGANVTGLAAGSCTAIGCRFANDVGVTLDHSNGGTVEYFDCVVNQSLTIGNGTTGRITGGSVGLNGGVLTFSGTGQGFVECALNQVNIASTGGDVSVTNTGRASGSATVTSTSISVSLTGAFTTVTFSGAPAALRVFKGHVTQILDFTGPGIVHAQTAVAGVGNRATLRGAGIRADLQVPGVTSPFLKLIGVTDSLVTADFTGGTAGAQAYTVDAACARVVLITSGTYNGFTVASTNAGSFIHIIDEKADSLVSTPAVPNPTLLMGELAAIQSGVQTIPAATGGSPSGAASGSLAGTYPGPTFAGRDSSVDKLNQDMLPAYISDINGVQVFPGTPAVAVTDFDHVFMLMGG